MRSEPKPRSNHAARRALDKAEQAPIRVLLADDHPAFRRGLRAVLEADRGFTVVGEAANGAQALAFARELGPDVLLLDLFMPQMNGLQVLEEMHALGMEVPTIVVTIATEDKLLFQAFRWGARGLISKDAALVTYVQAIRSVLAGDMWVDPARLAAGSRARTLNNFGLGRRELQIVREVCAGGSNREIAARLCCSENTVKSHVSRIYTKLGVSSRAELALFARSQSLLD